MSLREWAVGALIAFWPLFVLELHHLAERRRIHWSSDRRALRALEATWRR